MPRVQVGGSLRRSLGASLLQAAGGWACCEVVVEAWDPEDEQDAHALSWLAERTTLLPHSLSLNVLGDAASALALTRARAWSERLAFGRVSDHFAWTASEGREPGVFLPPFEEAEALRARIERRRDQLGCPLSLENIALATTDRAFVHRYHERLAAACSGARAPVLLDLENLWLDAAASGEPIQALLAHYDSVEVASYHVGGGERIDGLWLDTHRLPVRPEVLSLLRAAVSRRPAPVVYERDYALDAESISREVRRIDEALTEPEQP